VNASNLKEYQSNAEFIRVSDNAAKESEAHGK
jgi:hypothetical protein